MQPVNSSFYNIAQFQRLLRSKETSEKEIRQATFTVLAKHLLEELINGLNDVVLIQKVHRYANERTTTLFTCICSLNQLGDEREHLTSSSLFQESMKLLEEAKQNFFALARFNVDMTEELQKAFAGNPNILKRVAEWNIQMNAQRNPLDVILKAMNNLMLPSRTLEEQRQKENELCEALQSWLLKNDLKRPIEDIIAIFKFPDRAVIDVFYKQFLIAREKAKEIYARRQAGDEVEIFVNKMIVLNSLNAYQAFREQFHSSSNYQEYRSHKQTVYETIRQIASFCQLGELINHRKIANDSRDRLYKKAQRLGFSSY